MTDTPQIDDRRRFKELRREIIFARIAASLIASVALLALGGTMEDIDSPYFIVPGLVLMALVAGLPTAVARRGWFVAPLIALAVAAGAGMMIAAYQLWPKCPEYVSAIVIGASIGFAEGLTTRYRSAICAGLLGGAASGLLAFFISLGLAAALGSPAFYWAAGILVIWAMGVTFHMGLAFSYALGRHIRKRRGEPRIISFVPRFSLRTLLIVVVLVGSSVGLVVRHYHLSSAADRFVKAVRRRDVEQVRVMLRDFPGLADTVDKHGTLPLVSAIINDDVNVCSLLLECGADPDGRWERNGGLSLLQLAVCCGNEKVANVLVAHGAEIDLHSASVLGLVSDMERLLDDGSVSVDAQLSKRNRTPLTLAAEHGEVAAALLLINRGADVGHREDYDYTALHLAVQNGHVEVARLLLGSGADINSRDHYLTSPLHLVTSAEMCKLLLESGANARAVDKDGSMPLLQTSSRASPEVVGLLIAAGGDPNHVDKKGEFALAYAAGSGNLAMARALIAAGADVNLSAKTADGRKVDTALMWAVEAHQAEMVGLLLASGADPNATDEKGATVLEWAKARRTSKEIMDALSEAAGGQKPPETGEPTE